VTEIMVQLAAGDINAVTVAIWIVFAFLLAMAGGALMGMRLAGKDLGNELAATLGAMLGPTGAVPGVFVGLIVLAFLKG
jgi:hypothetical protein